MNQNEAVILTIEKLGGVATLADLYSEVLKIDGCVWKTKTPFASIRRIVQLNKNIYKIRPGLYGLLKYKQQNETKGIIVENEQNKNSKVVQEFNHSYYQGLLLIMGKMKELETYVPNQDKNKLYVGRKLGDLKTLDTIPQFSYDNLVKRSSTIDVIWFNERNMPHTFFEVEHSTDIQNSLLKFNDLQDFYTRMVIVADKVRESEFEGKIKYSGFKDLRMNKRVEFLEYEQLIKQFNSLSEQQSMRVIL